MLRRLSLAGGSVIGSVGGLLAYLALERVYTRSDFLNDRHSRP